MNKLDETNKNDLSQYGGCIFWVLLFAVLLLWGGFSTSDRPMSADEAQRRNMSDWADRQYDNARGN